MSSAPAGQAEPEGEAEAPAEGLPSSAGAQPASVVRSTAAPPTAAMVYLLTMLASLGHVPPVGAVRRHPVMSCHNRLP
ncbi:hypothetical protein Adi01nite_23220 [Amorphoplanes digitatis]|nr:hypothetical protein GCM10020092_029940 [Actinoplanes digitatis]GID92910.1 hypothetical protein Adi01nite_23220 [Actinoplanes digitatis]